MSKLLGAALAFVWLLCAWSMVLGQEIVTGNAGEIIRLQSKFKGEVDWIVPESLDSSARSYKNLAAKELIVVPLHGGHYQIYAISAEGGKPLQQRFIVVAKGVTPVPPGPGPEPPPDTFETRVKIAYELDVAAGEGGDAERKTVAAAFAQFGQFLPLLKKSDEVKTVIEVTAAGVLKGKLPKTMVVIYAHLSEAVPEFSQAVDLTPDSRARFVATFTEISVALNLGPQPPPPSPPGQRTILIIRETADSTPEMARLIVALRTGQHAKYFADKGHMLSILDDDAVGPDGRPAPVIEKWRPHFKDMKLPALLVLDNEKILSREPLPSSADAVIEAVKKAGG